MGLNFAIGVVYMAAPRLTQHQSQQLVMTQRLHQSLKILQLSSLDLDAYVTQEIEQNPFLLGETMLEEERTENHKEETPKEVTTLMERNPAYEAAEFGNEPPNHDGEAYKNFYDDVRTNYHSHDREHMDRFLEEGISQEKSLKEVVLDQIHLTFQTLKERFIAIHLLDYLSDSGYLQEEYLQLVEQLHCEPSDITKVLTICQSFEPVGIFARSLQECLTIQLRERNRLDPWMRKLVAHLDLVALGNMPAIEKRCGIPQEELPFMITEIKTLEPKPGRVYSNDIIQLAIPDVFLYRDVQGEWIVELNPKAFPKLSADRNYYDRVSKSLNKNDDNRFLSDRWQTAQTIVKAVDQRADTILRVARAIASYQRDFFEYGIHYLKPMTLASIASELALHESTISRVTNNKYISTPHGTYEMKYFFSTAIASTFVEQATSNMTVKHMIKTIISEEIKDHAFSDSDICMELEKKGIVIARRTVAKYRESLGIPTYNERKKSYRCSA